MSTLDALPVVVSGAVGTTKSLFDVLTQAYGDDVSKIQSVFIGVNGVSGSFWTPGQPVATTVVDLAGHTVSGNVNFADFKNVQIVVGNNINTNVFVTVSETVGNNFVGRTLGVTALQSTLDLPNAADHIPTADDIVKAAKLLVSVEGGVANVNDCHGIASAIAASAGATLDVNSGHTNAIVNGVLETPNEQGGFWRIAFENGSAGANWESQVEAGDIVRMRRADGGVHTVTVVSKLNADGNHPGKIEVVDNWNGVISQHWDVYDDKTVANSVTIYRLSPDGIYLTDESKETSGHSIVGTNFNDLIQAGLGGDTLRGGHGNDTLDGGAGDDTAVFTGKQSDYKITVVDGKTAILTDLRAGSPDGTDTIKNIEHVKFGDAAPVNFGDLKTTVVTPPPPPPPPPPVHVAGSVSISDVTITEGSNGSHTETFTVKRTGGDAAFDVNFATADGSAKTADGDYTENHGPLHFDAGVNERTISIVVNGDTRVEDKETFNINLSGATNGATISKAQGVISIANDDVAAPAPVAGSVAISDVTITEGNNGSHIETFTVTRAGGKAAFDVNFATSDGSAKTADGDYAENHGPLHFAEGVNEQKISIVVNGDTKVEPTETFKINLSGATNGAVIADGEAVITIRDDDVAKPVAPSVSIGDKTITEGSNGSHIETFTVTRTGGDGAFDVHYATAAGSASGAAGDYTATGGDLHFDAGVNERKISIVINGDTTVEPTETFKINLSGATNGAVIADGEAIITIKNDDVAATHHVSNDFNGDGISDLLLGKTNGSLALWELNGNHIDANVTVATVPAGWHIDGIGDFGGDGKADILMHNDSGKVAMWQMDGNHVASNTTVGSVGSDWHVIGTDDFNGDGKADILWQNSKGQVAMWQMDGDHVASNTSVGSIGTDWKVIGTDDFNGDGKADILWENSKGQVAMWQMDGDHVASNTSVGSIGTNWHAAGTGDFDGDGKADVLWQNDKGAVAMWQMNGNHIDSNTSVGSAAGWSVIGTGDYNHDGKADVLFENASGKVAQWQMNGDHIAENLSVGSHSIDWHHV